MPDPRPRYPILLVPKARLNAIIERRQRTSSVKKVVFILVEAWHMNMSWLTMRLIFSSLMKWRGSSKMWSRRRTKAMVRIKTRDHSKR
jgi:hypothetical protein